MKTKWNSILLITLQKKLDQLPAVDIQHAPAKLPSKLHIFAYVDFLAQSLCSVHSDCVKKSTYANMWSLDGSLAGAC